MSENEATKRLFTPETTHELLNGWLIHAHKGRDRHDSAARRYTSFRYWLGVPTLIVSTIVGTSVFSALTSQMSPPLWIAILSVSAAVLTALQTFLDFATKADRHRAAAVKYKAVIREIEQHVIICDDGKEHGAEISGIRTKLDNLEDEAPVILPIFYDEVEVKYENVTFVKEALSLFRK